MTDNLNLNVSAQDVLAAIGFEAQRIVAAVGQHSAGYPFPDPGAIQKTLDRMNELNRVLAHAAASGVLAAMEKALQRQPKTDEGTAEAAAGMTAKLN